MWEKMPNNLKMKHMLEAEKEHGEDATSKTNMQHGANMGKSLGSWLNQSITDSGIKRTTCMNKQRPNMKHMQEARS